MAGSLSLDTQTRHGDSRGKFLIFLAEDMKRRPEALKALSPAIAERLAALAEGVRVDLDTPIDGDDDL